MDLLFLLCCILALTSCNNINTQEQTKIADTSTEERMPFINLTRDDVDGIKIFEASLESEIALSEDETINMVDLLNNVVIYEEVVEEERAGQMIHIKINKIDGTSIIVKEFNPYIIIDDVWYKAKYEPCEEINKYANEIIN